ncbi:MAG: hypothetical protein JW861_13915 [Bacteroidales bacterium]|nr:hypothetical protein [Bacteroidales bacterium]
MNIIKESTGEHTASIRVEVKSEDYRDKVDKALKDLQKQSVLKGFRPGKVPIGLIRKMYEKATVAEEIDRLISESLNSYLAENKIQILGYPLANKEKNNRTDLETTEDFEFWFDIGLVPDFRIDLGNYEETEHYIAGIGDDEVEQRVEDIRKRYGKEINPETVGEEDMIRGVLEELDETGQVREQGIKNQTSIHVDLIRDPEIRNRIIGMAKMEKVDFNPLTAAGSSSDAASLLGITNEEADRITGLFRLTVHEIVRIDPVALSAELFSRVFPGKEINTEEGFREEIRKDLENYYQQEYNNFFSHMAIEKLISSTPIPLPDDFLKRWLAESEDHITEEVLQRDYHHYSNSIRQELIIQRIARDFQIEIGEKDIRDHIKGWFKTRYFGNHTTDETVKHLDSLAESMMQNKEEVKRIHNQLFDEKLNEVLRNEMKTKPRKVSYQEFIRIVREHQKSPEHEQHG